MKKHIICYGDSNTHGYCAMNDGRFDENERWTCLLQKSLGEDYLILEEGLSGRTTSFRDPVFEGLSGLDYLYPCLMSHEPVDLLVIMLGTNDTKERFSAGAPAIGLGMIRLVKKAIATLLDNLKDGCPLNLLSQFMPIQYTKVREGSLKNDPKELVLDRVGNTIDEYLYATHQRELF